MIYLQIFHSINRVESFHNGAMHQNGFIDIFSHMNYIIAIPCFIRLFYKLFVWTRFAIFSYVNSR